MYLVPIHKLFQKKKHVIAPLLLLRYNELDAEKNKAQQCIVNTGSIFHNN